MRRRAIFTRMINLAFTIMLAFTMMAGGFRIAKQEVSAESQVPETHVDATYTLTVKKETVSNQQGVFIFRIKAYDGDVSEDTPISYYDLSRRFSMIFVGEGAFEFKLKNGESIDMKFDHGTIYEIYELAQNGWKLVSIDGDENMTKATGRLTDNKTVTFLNQIEEDNPKIEEPITEEPKDEGTTEEKNITVTPQEDTEEVVVTNADKDDEKEKSSKSVDTSDTDYVTPWLVSLLASAASLAAIGYGRLRNRNERI